MSKFNKGKGRLLKMDDRIIRVLQKEPLKSFNYKQISSLIKINDRNERQRVLLLLENMLKEGTIESVARGKYRYKHQDNFVQGTVDLTSNGSAYIRSSEIEKDIYISQRNMGGALNGDTVNVLLYAQKKNKKPEGHIVEVVKRHRTEFVGIVQLAAHHAFVVPDSRKMPYDFFIPKEHIKGAKDGEKVIVAFTDWPKDAKNPFAKIIFNQN